MSRAGTFHQDHPVTHIPPGLYPAPYDAAHLQYWNGAEWTAETRSALQPAVHPAFAVGSAPGSSAAALGPAEPIVTAGYVLAVLIPIVGLVVGIMAAARPNPATSRHGMPIVQVSVLAFVVFVALIGAAS